MTTPHEPPAELGSSANPIWSIPVSVPDLHLVQGVLLPSLSPILTLLDFDSDSEYDSGSSLPGGGDGQLPDAMWAYPQQWKGTKMQQNWTQELVYNCWATTNGKKRMLVKLISVTPIMKQCCLRSLGRKCCLLRLAAALVLFASILPAP